MQATVVRRTHGKTVGALFISGYFLLFFSAGTFASAALLSHKASVAASSWTQATAQIRDCEVGVYNATIRIGGNKLYALRCAMTYQLAGRTYRNSLHSNFTRS